MSFSPESSRMLVCQEFGGDGWGFYPTRFSGVNPDAVNDGQGPQMDSLFE